MTITERHPFDRLTGRAILLASLFGALVPAVIAIVFARGDYEGAAAVAMVAGYVGVLLVLLVLAAATGVSLERLLGPMPGARDALVALGIGLVLLTLSFGVMMAFLGALGSVFPSLLETWLSSPPMDVVIERDGRIDPMSSGLMVLSAAILAPMVEELLFRGFLLTRWARRFGVRGAVVGSALLFGLLHFSLDPIGAFVLGLVTAVLYLHTRSLLVPMLVHAASNGTVVVFLFLLRPSAAERPMPSPDDLRTMILVGTALIAVTAPVVALALKAWWPAPDAPLPYDDPAEETDRAA